MAQDHDQFYSKVKTCDAIYGDNKFVKYFILHSINNLYLGVVVYIHKQLKNGGSEAIKCEEHFPSKTEQEAVESCEKWIKQNISNDIKVTCIK